MKKIMFVFGTRPEAVKLAPLIKKVKLNKKINVCLCVTGQHRQMLDQVLDFFNIKTDYDLNLMKKRQSLTGLTTAIIRGVDEVITKVKPDLVIVQGDTTSSYAGALAAFYNKIKIAYVEDGLRSFDKYSPFPEEMNRVAISHMADFHFAPTKLAAMNLLKEGISNSIHITGNTVVDALFLGLDIIKREGDEKYLKLFKYLDFSKKIILATVHRRESFGEPLVNICNALKKIAVSNKDKVEIIYPVHLNPNVKLTVSRILSNLDNIHLVSPLDYSAMIWLMNKSYLIITDSGGIQEEAPSLNKPILIVREVTERPEGIEAGVAKLVGCKTDEIVKNVNELLNSGLKYKMMVSAISPYGDGFACDRIIKVIKNI